MTVIPTGYAEATIGISSTYSSHISSISFAFAMTTELADVTNVYGVLQAALPDISQDMLEAYQMDTVRFTFPDGEGGTGSITFPFEDDIGGGTAGEQHDIRSAYVMRKQTSHIGRHGVGRFYLPGVKEADVDDLGKVELVRQDSINNHLASFMDKLLNPDDPFDPAQPYLLHSDDTDPYPISVITVAPLVGRLTRRGRT